jgi:hypothetical protein
MYDPIMRVLTVLEILQAREHVTGAELAQQLEVNLRTVSAISRGCRIFVFRSNPPAE